MDVISKVTVAALSPDDLDGHLGGLADVLLACVEDGASVGYVLPFTRTESEAFWNRKVFPQVREGTRLLWAASLGGRTVGTVQLDCDTMPNQPHRAEVRKLLVHPACRRQGVARLLMAELERCARDIGRSLLTLDTRTGDMAEPLYASMGYSTAGVIPGYCRDTIEDRLDPTTIMYKAI